MSSEYCPNGFQSPNLVTLLACEKMFSLLGNSLPPHVLMIVRPWVQIPLGEKTEINKKRPGEAQSLTTTLNN